jgi:hypothetical protein
VWCACRFDDIEPHLPWILENIDLLGPYTGTQFTCFTGTTAQILTLRPYTGTQFTCYTGTKVQILMLRAAGLLLKHIDELLLYANIDESEV